MAVFRHQVAPDSEVAAPMREVGLFLLQMGWIGVDLFFVLSGFLVSGLLFREHRRHGGIAMGRFYVRRGFKIYPAFYLLLLVTWWMMQHGFSSMPRNASQRLLYEAVYVQNYWGGLWNHTWSLAVEEHFYFRAAGADDAGRGACQRRLRKRTPIEDQRGREDRSQPPTLVGRPFGGRPRRMGLPGCFVLC